MQEFTRKGWLQGAARLWRWGGRLAALALLAPIALAQAIVLGNGGFEQGTPAEALEGWAVFPAGCGATAEVSTQRASQGTRAAFLDATSIEAVDDGVYLHVSQSAAGMGGRRFSLSANLRMEKKRKNAGATLWVKVVSSSGQVQIHRSQQVPVTGTDWRNRQVVFDVPNGSEWIYMALHLNGRGMGWIDDVALQTVGICGGVPQPPMELVSEELTNLMAFSKVLGYMRYFHPSDQAADADWDSVAIDGVRQVTDVHGPVALAQALERIFQPFGPTMQVFPTGAEVPVHGALAVPAKKRGARFHTLEHRGLGRPGGRLYGSRRKSTSLLRGGFPTEVYERDLPGGVTCRVPLALWGDRNHTFPILTSPTLGPAVLADPLDRATRLASLALAWNGLQHFYPYFDLVGELWPGALEAGLKKAALDSTAYAFRLTLRQLAAKLEDVHAVVETREADIRNAILPIWLEWVEGAATVVRVQQGLPDPHPELGDHLIEFDGMPIEEAMAWHAQAVSAPSERVLHDRTLLDMLFGPLGQAADLVFESIEGERRECTLDYGSPSFIKEGRLPRIHELEPGILYVDISRLEMEQLEADCALMRQARGVLFDFRGYPNVPAIMATLLTSKPLASPTWKVPVFTRPDREGVAWSESSWKIFPAGSVLPGKVAFLTNSEAQSAAETNLSFIEAYELAEIVGEPTAGTNGVVTQLQLPAGYKITFTGMRVLKQDGSEHHGVGIRPTVPVSRTRAGVAQGRDEILERAIEVVKNIGDSALERGDFYLGLAQWEAAIAEYSIGLETTPGDAVLLDRRSQAYFVLEDNGRALADRMASEKLGEKSSTWYLERGLIHWSAMRFDEVLRDHRRALELEPESDYLMHQLAMLLFARAEYGPSLELFERVLQGDDEDLREAHLFAWMARNRLGHEGADEKLRGFLEKESDEGELYSILARALIGDLSPIEAEAQVAENYGADTEFINISVNFFLGSLYLMEGDQPRARQHLEACAVPGQGFMPQVWMARDELLRK